MTPGKAGFAYNRSKATPKKCRIEMNHVRERDLIC